jgi:cytochrome c oxidase assembly factor CtaG
MNRFLLAAALLAMASPALAHGGDGQAAGWTWDPWITLPLGLSAAVFCAGCVRLARRARSGGVELRRRAGFFGAGWLVLAVALVSPIHQAGERSFAFHMAEHELLMLAAPPLLVLSRPIAVMLWALPAQGRQALAAASRRPWFAAPWRLLTDPVVATVAQATVLWLWHAPALFDLSLTSEGWHAAQHLCFVVSSLFFWSAMLEGQGRRRPGLAAACLFATSLVSGALGALMALSQSPWYQPYAALGLDAFGLSPVEDQQLAGLLMWIPGGVVHAGAALIILARALRLGGDGPGENLRAAL